MDKTPQMRAVEEKDPAGRDIRQMLLDAYRQHGNTLMAGRSLGISQGTFSNWVALLGGSIGSRLVFPDSRGEIVAAEPARAEAGVPA